MNLEPVIDDAVLLDGLRRGDDHAFATLVRQHAGRMLATARRLLRDGDEAEDAVQTASWPRRSPSGDSAGDPNPPPGSTAAPFTTPWLGPGGGCARPGG